MSKTYFLILICCAMFYSCSENESRSVNGEVQTNELWIFNITTATPTEGGFSITDQPRNAVRSEILTDVQFGGLSYFYRSVEGFTGIEQITIESCFSPGDDNFTCTDINIELEVTE